MDRGDRRGAALIAAAGLVAALALPTTARSQTLGSDLTRAATVAPAGCTSTCTYAQTVPERTRINIPDGPAYAVVVRWRLRSTGTPRPVRLRVVKLSQGGFPGTTLVTPVGGAAGDWVTPRADDTVETFPARIPMQRFGDGIGLEQDGAGLAVAAALPGSTVGVWDPFLDNGVTRDPSSTLQDTELLVSADLESDGDGDGFGDQTQDACPTDGATQGPCTVDLLVERPAESATAVPFGEHFAVLFTAVNASSTGSGPVTATVELAGGGRPVTAAMTPLPPSPGSPAPSFPRGQCTVGAAVTCTVAFFSGNRMFGFGPPPTPRFSVAVKAEARGRGPLRARATITGPLTDPNPANNSLEHVIRVTGSPPRGCRAARLGTMGKDRLTGDRRAQTLAGLEDRDVLDGRSGADCLLGGSGDDVVRGGAGRDQLHGGPGSDVLSGGAGNDRIRARDGTADTVRCGQGRDVVWADRVDRLSGCERRR